MQMLGATLVNGVVVGMMYGLLAMALILLLQTTGVFNFAQGDVGMLVAFVSWALITSGKWPVGLAVLASVPISAALGVLLYFVVIRPGRADPVGLSLRSLGLLVLFIALAQRTWGTNAPYTFPKLLPDSGVAVSGFNITWLQLATLVFTIALALLVSFILQRTRIGLMIRAVRANRVAAFELGVNVAAIEITAWAAAAVVSGVVGILFAMLTFLAPTMMAPFLLSAFAAAMLGGLYSMAGALAGGVLLGVVQSASSVYLNQPELTSLIAFLILVAGLLLRRERLALST
ncbi:branched-chain amino acid ABC transporter permease [Ramlibacter sp. G-1-2-2]|uniref:Branched-chain amino acid ABC transporter permease n=1 Tax=Ramlibacter agri TaxID=2728837 RepID=A0A848H572_9BURK|nr:branched-chain amino acid ABC transporter permease [Ramlibacter agri]NML45714.1 branched-chain amino acid ABC transporter permease [Ramlibacter agri]